MIQPKRDFGGMSAGTLGGQICAREAPFDVELACLPLVTSAGSPVSPKVVSDEAILSPSRRS